MEMKQLVGVGALVGLMVACGSDLAEEAGEMLVDAGEVLRDAGVALVDGGGGDARAQTEPAVETYEVACSLRDRQVYGSLPPDPNLNYTYSALYAVLPVDINGITGVDVIQCRAMPFEPCPREGVTCEQSTLPRPPRHVCVTARAELGEGFIRTDCTVERRGFPAYETARITIRRR